MSKPTIVFCHGAWHSPDFFHKVIALLEPRGYKCVPLALPSVGSVPATVSLDQDIEIIRNAVLKELDGGNDVVVHAHSWGGIPSSSALEGLSKAERAQHGSKTSVTKITYATAFVLPIGVSLQDAVGGVQEDWQVDDDGNVLNSSDWWLPKLYHDLDPTEAEKWISKLKPHSLATFQQGATAAAWKKIPSAYLICEDDKAIPLQGQESMVAAVKDAGGEIEVERVFSAHSPHLTQPEIVADFLRRAAGEVVG